MKPTEAVESWLHPRGGGKLGDGVKLPPTSSNTEAPPVLLGLGSSLTHLNIHQPYLTYLQMLQKY